MREARMRFSEFKDWFSSVDTQLEGRAPDLKLWWELKARLEAVVPEVASSSAPPSPLPAIPAAASPSPGPQPEDTEIADFDPSAGPTDPEPADFRARSRDKDGGLMAEAVDLLREQQADLRRRA